MNELKIEDVAINTLKSWKRNARTHSKKQVGQIAKSFLRFGFTVPILIDEDNNVLAGHGRLAAARTLGWKKVPCIRIATMTAADKRAYVIADNKLAQNAGWDEQLLAKELDDLLALDFDVSLTGFSEPEVHCLINGMVPEEDGDPRDNDIPKKAPSRCKPGDIWQLGDSRLICGDARDVRVIDALMNGNRAHTVFTDPPFNVPIAGNVSGRGVTKHGNFAMASGEMSSTQFTDFLRTSAAHMATYSVNGAIVFICMDWRHMRELIDATYGIFSELKNVAVWVKDNGGMGTFYRSRHEMVFIYKNGTAAHLNNFELGQHGRYRTNVWEYRGVNTRKSGRMDELSKHPTAKPVDMIAHAILDVSPRGGIVLDPFGGSGSTLIAAYKTGRRGYLVEYDAAYCDVIIERWEKYANDTAVQIACGIGSAPAVAERKTD